MKQYSINMRIQIEAENMDEADALADLIQDSLREEEEFNNRTITNVYWDSISPVSDLEKL